MKKREFNKCCRIHFGKRKKGEPALSDEQKHDMLLYIIKNRGPVHRSLATSLLDWGWFHSMGYLYADGKFLHTAATRLGI